MWTESLVVALTVAVPVTLVAILVQILSALLERSGPIRLRHWAEESEGRILDLFEAPVRFEVFRFLLGWLAKLAPVALVVVVWPTLRGTAADPLLMTIIIVVALVAVTELLNAPCVSSRCSTAWR
jgi:hypothetical protein